jgi:hypothetical protein
MTRKGAGDQRYAEREQHIWGGVKGGNKVDIITHYKINYQGFMEAIELKCASVRQDEKPGDLAERMQEDMLKLIDGQKYLKPIPLTEMKRWYGVSIAITLDPASTKATEAALAIEPGMKVITRLDYGPKDGSSRTITIWAYWLYIPLPR